MLFKVRAVVFATLSASGAFGCRAGAPAADGDADLVPPAALRIPERTELHGEVRVDPYAWLRDRDDPRSRAYLEAENRYTDAVLQHTAARQQTVFEEMLAQTVEDDTSLPVVEGRYGYSVREEAGKPYALLVRQAVLAGGEFGDEELVFDGNAIAGVHAFFQVASWQVSEDQRKVAIAYDTVGDDRVRIRVLDISSGAQLEEFGEDSGRGSEIRSPVAVWANDSTTLFYTRADRANRPWQLWRHRVGSNAPDVLVHQEDDPRFHLGVERTRSGAFVVLQSSSWTTAESHVLSADDPEGEFLVVEPRKQGVLYDIDHQGETFFVRTNHRVPTSR